MDRRTNQPRDGQSDGQTDGPTKRPTDGRIPPLQRCAVASKKKKSHLHSNRLKRMIKPVFARPIRKWNDHFTQNNRKQLQQHKKTQQKQQKQQRRQQQQQQQQQLYTSWTNLHKLVLIFSLTNVNLLPSLNNYYKIFIQFVISQLWKCSNCIVSYF